MLSSIEVTALVPYCYMQRLRRKLPRPPTVDEPSVESQATLFLRSASRSRSLCRGLLLVRLLRLGSIELLTCHLSLRPSPHHRTSENLSTGTAGPGSAYHAVMFSLGVFLVGYGISVSAPAAISLAMVVSREDVLRP